jgi:hypothetical protein
MRHTWKILVTLVMVTGVSLFLATAIYGGGSGEPSQEKEKKKDKLDEIQAQLKSLADSMESKHTALIGSLAKSFEDVQKDVGSLKKSIQQLKDELAEQKIINNLAAKKIQALDETVARLLSDMAAMKIKMEAVKLYPPYTSKFPPSGTCKVVLVNNTPEQLTFIFNGDSVPVGPFRAQTLEAQPAGVFSYKVLSPSFGLLKQNTTVLKANDLFNIQVGY